MTTKIRTLIADDEEGPREQLRAALERLAPELEIVAASVNGCDAWDDCLAHEPQLCFLDIRMPGLSGLEVGQRLSQLAEPPQKKPPRPSGAKPLTSQLPIGASRSSTREIRAPSWRYRPFSVPISRRPSGICISAVTARLDRPSDWV